MHLFELFVGFRYLFSKKKKSVLSLTTLISIGGIAIGVMALMVVLSVMNGFSKDIQSKILGFKSHIVIESKNFLPFLPSPNLISELRTIDSNIIEISPYVSTEMMARREGMLQGILYKGMDGPLMKAWVADRDRVPPVWVGKELAYSLRVRKGDLMEIISPIETTGPLGVLPKLKRYRVAGLIETGLYEYDTKLVVATLSEAQQFLEYNGKIDGIELKVSNLYETNKVMDRIKILPSVLNLEIRDWPMLNKKLFSALKLEKLAMFVILSFMVLVAALNIITTITRIVVEKKKEISILKTMGANQKNIMIIFLIQGMCIGMTGILLGTVGGWGICSILQRYELIRLPDIYYYTAVPVEMDISQFMMIGCVAFLITGLCSWYPAWKASRIDPLEGIHG